MVLKRDRVNRVSGLVYLPIDGSGLSRGDTVPADKVHVQERDIDILVKDAMAMSDPMDGNAIGDAIMDAMKDPYYFFDVIGGGG